MAHAEKKSKIFATVLYQLFMEASGEKEEEAIADVFTRYCVKHNHAWLLPKIEREVLALEKKEKGIIDAEIVSAVTLNDAERKKIVAEIASLLKKDSVHIAPRFSEDVTIGGGLLVKAGEYMIDGTVTTALKKLKKQLTA